MSNLKKVALYLEPQAQTKLHDLKRRTGLGISDHVRAAIRNYLDKTPSPVLLSTAELQKHGLEVIDELIRRDLLTTVITTEKLFELQAARVTQCEPVASASANGLGIDLWLQQQR